MDKNRISEKLAVFKTQAQALGFDAVGVAEVNTKDLAQRYGQWLEMNYQGEMGYMERTREKRSDPDQVLPGVQSVICLRMNYLTQDKDMSYLKDRRTGDISLYALNLDYHDIVLPRLKKLEAVLREQFPGSASKVYVDTGPVLEKPMAQLAGLGWVGKHTNLLTQSVGSWYFLAEILIDVDLPKTQPAVDRCGTCERCIRICPTDAIVAPYVLDSRRCISYLTIELKGPIPLEFRKAIGNRVYGCDDCQIVCPWNSFAVKTDVEEFQEPERSRDLIALMGLTDEGFRQFFRKSPVKRIKRRGFLRNVAVALGNSGDQSAIEPLMQVLGDPEPLIRAHVVWALGELMGTGAMPILEDKLAGEDHPWVLEEIQGLKDRLRVMTAGK